MVAGVSEGIGRFYSVFRGAGDGLLRGGDPERVGVEEEKEDHAEGHEVHVDAEDNAAVIEAPAALHATDGVRGACEGDQRRKDESRSGVVVGEVREQKRGCEAGEDQDAAAQQRVGSRIEDGWSQRNAYSQVRIGAPML
jgi:hypothetical protein